MATVDVLVAGANGNTGRPVVEELLTRGASVRAMVRSAGSSPAGAEAVVADFDDAGSIRAALAGVRRAYLVTPSSERAEQQQMDFVDAAKEAGVERLVVLSQLAARADSPVRFLRYHAAVEQHVRDSGLDHTFLRPNLYYQGLLAVAGLVADGVLPAPIGDAQVSAVDVRDIAAVAAAALTEDGTEGRPTPSPGRRRSRTPRWRPRWATPPGARSGSSTSPPTSSQRACRGSCPRGRSTGCSRTTRTTPGARRARSRPPSRT